MSWKKGTAYATRLLLRSNEYLLASIQNQVFLVDENSFRILMFNLFDILLVSTFFDCAISSHKRSSIEFPGGFVFTFTF